MGSFNQPNVSDIGKEFFAKFFDPSFYVPELGEYNGTSKQYMTFQTMNEVNAYKHLESLQGSGVPRFFGHYKYMKDAEELIDVILLEKINAPSCATLQGLDFPQIKRLSQGLIRHIHSCGVLHNDIATRNMFWDFHGRGLIICDFSAANTFGNDDINKEWVIELKGRDTIFMEFAVMEMTQSQKQEKPGKVLEPMDSDGVKLWS